MRHYFELCRNEASINKKDVLKWNAALFKRPCLSMRLEYYTFSQIIMYKLLTQMRIQHGHNSSLFQWGSFWNLVGIQACNVLEEQVLQSNSREVQLRDIGIDQLLTWSICSRLATLHEPGAITWSLCKAVPTVIVANCDVMAPQICCAIQLNYSVQFYPSLFQGAQSTMLACPFPHFMLTTILRKGSPNMFHGD